MDLSVVIPCYNASPTIGSALNSILRQSHRPDEVVIVDDGGGDSVALRQRVAEFSRQLNITVVSHGRNRGAPVARNTGIATSKGRFVALLDADDFWAREKVQVQLAVMGETNCDFSCHGYCEDTTLTALTAQSRVPKHKRLRVVDFVWGNPVVTPTVMFKRIAAPIFHEGLRRCDDYKAWIEAVSGGARFIKICANLAGGAKPAIGHSGLTADVDKMHYAFITCLEMIAEGGITPRWAPALAKAIEYCKYPLRKGRVAGKTLLR
ncbi:MAG: glycosyltransferase family 2 protein [Armatimonadota bacterium]|nr:glycosyltransferase family 2 protein [Armatimonadota bacterium]